MPALPPLVSVLMPVFNAGPFLQECLDSIQAQTLDPWELLAIDDHSTDHSRSILQAYAGRDARIRWLANPGKGIQEALRHGFELSAGRWITRMDADDRMFPRKLEVLVDQAKKAGQGTIVAGQVNYFSTKELGEGYRKYAAWINQVVADNAWEENLYRECVLPSPCWMAHREDLAYCGAFEGSRYPEDYDLCFRLFAGGMALKGIPEPLHYWRDHPRRSSRTRAVYQDNAFFDLKTDWFQRLHRDYRYPLLLWGAGKKGKEVARRFLHLGLSFRWITDNPRKIGQEIYGRVLRSREGLGSWREAQVCVVVSRDDERAGIRKDLITAGFQPGNVFLFR